MRLHLGIGYISGNMDIKDDQRLPENLIEKNMKDQQKSKGNGAQRR